MQKSISQHRSVDTSSPSSVPLLDVNRGNAPLREEFLSAIAAVCDSGRFLYGPDVEEFERAVAAICDVRHAIGCASGSDALLLALMAHDIGPGDEVITSSFTFFATASCIWRLGACPVFVDIEPDGFNIDPERIEAAITPATKAIIPVHLFGQCADMDAISDIAARRNLKVIEDAAQSIGAEYRARPAGSIGDIGCFSFYPTKNLGGFGDGGMLTTNDDGLAERLRQLAAHGMKPRYYHSMVGINSRLDSIQAGSTGTLVQPASRQRGQVSPAVCRIRVRPLAGDARAIAAAIPRLESVHDPRSPRKTRRTPRKIGGNEDRHRNLLSDPAAPAGVLPDARVRAGQSPRDRTRRSRSAQPADLPGIDRGRTAVGGV
jgi:hypothetical protein